MDIKPMPAYQVVWHIFTAVRLHMWFVFQLLQGTLDKLRFNSSANLIYEVLLLPFINKGPFMTIPPNCDKIKPRKVIFKGHFEQDCLLSEWLKIFIIGYLIIFGIEQYSKKLHPTMYKNDVVTHLNNFLKCQKSCRTSVMTILTITDYLSEGFLS